MRRAPAAGRGSLDLMCCGFQVVQPADEQSGAFQRASLNRGYTACSGVARLVLANRVRLDRTNDGRADVVVGQIDQIVFVSLKLKSARLNGLDDDLFVESVCL